MNLYIDSNIRLSLLVRKSTSIIRLSSEKICYTRAILASMFLCMLDVSLFLTLSQHQLLATTTEPIIKECQDLFIPH